MLPYSALVRHVDTHVRQEPQCKRNWYLVVQRGRGLGSTRSLGGGCAVEGIAKGRRLGVEEMGISRADVAEVVVGWWMKSRKIVLLGRLA